MSRDFIDRAGFLFVCYSSRMAEAWEAIEGAREFVKWFGHWPSFHDAEVIHVHLDRSGTSSLLVSTCELTSELLPNGLYGSRKNVDVEFVLSEVQDLELAEFNQQNVIFGLSVDVVDHALRISMEACYGMAGFVTAKAVSLRYTPHEGVEANHSASRSK